MWSTGIIITLAVFLVVEAQDCKNYPRSVKPCDCCSSKPNYKTAELAAECGLQSSQERHNRRMKSGSGDNHDRHSCNPAQCVLKKFNLLTSDNNIDVAAFKAFMETQYPDGLKSAINIAVDTCEAELTTATPDNCSSKKFMWCFKKNLALNCPDSEWVASTDCETLKTYLKNCPAPPNHPKRD